MTSASLARGPKLILVTDPSYADEAMLETIARVAPAFAPGALAVQLRDKARPIVALRLFASRLRVLTKQSGAWLLVNGNAELARDVGAEGVHLGGGAMSIEKARDICGDGAWISIAAHSDDAVRAALEEGADAALVSPIFPTRASPASHSQMRVRVKSEKTPRGLEALESARAIVESSKRKRFALYALGGVSIAHVRQCVDAGAHGVAVIRALLASRDAERDARAFAAALTP